ncbi:MAG: YbdD/YjiX family protein [Bordetella sp.]|nr:MAG: YbdD/YjiX family protein [Bordetella sp.]
MLFFNSIQKDAGTVARYLGQTLRLMVGVPDYDSYLEHMQKNHPNEKPMTYENFFRERQTARYGGKGRIGCC